MDNNEYLWLEDINSNRVLKFVNEFNLEFDSIVKDIRGMLSSEIDKFFNVDKVEMASGYRDGVYLLVNTGRIYRVIRYTDDGEYTNVISSDEFGKDVMIVGVLSNWKGNILCVFISSGSDKGVFKFIDIESGEVIQEFTDYASQILWLGEDVYIHNKFYRDEATPDGVDPPTSRLLLRNLYSDEAEMIFGEGVPTKHYIYLNCDYKRRWMYANIRRGWTSTKIFYNKFGEVEGWSLLYDAGDNYAFSAGYLDGSHIVTVYDGEKFGRILKVNGGVETLYEGYKYPVSDAFVCHDKLFIVLLVDASDKMYIYSDGLLKEVPLPLRVPLTLYNFTWSSRKLYFIAESFGIPASLYKYDPISGNLDSVYKYEVFSDVVVEEEFIKSFDGVDIHVFIVRNRQLDRGVALVHGYGGFGISMKPFYLNYLLKFIEDGGVYVLTNIRGGKEYGEQWHEEGMREKKFNVFRDYISVLNYLKRKGYRVIGFGRSNGGLLIGAVLNMSPTSMDLAIIGYPLLDMLRFHKLYIGGLWTTEYGDPEDPNDRVFLKKYSPIHNIGDVSKYPPILVYTGLYDDRVHPSHAFRYVAKMRDLGANIYLRTDTESGHLGASLKRKKDEYLDILSFIYKFMPI